MKTIFALTLPYIKSLSNRWNSTSKGKFTRGRDLMIAGVTILTVLTIYRGTIWSLRTIDELPILAGLPAELLISAVFSVLFLMITFSAIASSIGFLFSAKDLEFIVSSPAKPISILLTRATGVFITASWMPLTFVAPFLIAFGVHYKINFEFYLESILILFLLCISGACIGIFISVILNIILPRIKLAISQTTIFFLAISAGISLFSFILAFLINKPAPQDISKLINAFSAPYSFWLPARWGTAILSETINGNYRITPLAWRTLIFGIITQCLITNLIFDYLYFKAFSASRTNTKKSHNIVFYAFKQSEKLLQILKSPFKLLIPTRPYAMVAKELLTLIRDPLHLVEGIMLLAITSLFIYALQFLGLTSAATAQLSDTWLKEMLFLTVAMTAFIITACCTRFVFPSLSREGKGYWILQTSPLSEYEILKIKKNCWLAILGTLGFSFIFSIIAISTKDLISSFIVSIYSLVTVNTIISGAIGIGASLAKNEGDAPVRVSGGIGSFVFMIFSCGIILISATPAWLILHSEVVSLTSSVIIGSLLVVANLLLSEKILDLPSLNSSNS